MTPQEERAAKRMMERAQREGMTGTSDACWVWTGARSSRGYGHVGGLGHFLVHRLAWMFVHGEVPAGLELDHLCRVRACFNPAHLEPVTHQENIRRGRKGVKPRRTHCKEGHELDDANTWTHAKTGYRQCRKCCARRQRERRARLRSAA